MLLIHGLYRFAAKVVAYRFDYCNSCNDIVLSERFRTFNMYHFFFIPFLPLGFHRRWICKKCGNDPRARTQTSRGLLWVLFILVAFMTVALLFATTKPEDATMIWIMRAVFVGLSALLLYILTRKPAEDIGSQVRNSIPPFNDNVCLYCKGEIVKTAQNHQCSKCGVERLEPDRVASTAQMVAPKR